MQPTKQPGIGKRFLDKSSDHTYDEGAAREARIRERTERIQKRRTKRLELELKEKLAEGRETMKIGTEGKWKSREERREDLEKNQYYRTFNTK